MANPHELILIDGSSFLYRAYFAVKKSFTTKDGFPTGAIFVITRMFQGLLEQFEGSKMVLVFDAKGGSSFRQELYPEYKATRPPMPDDLRKQVEMVHEICVAMGFPVISVPNVEADDVLGSYTKAALSLGMQVVICTGDKDLAQLVEPNVSLLDTMKNIRYDEATVQEKYGVKPEHIIDLLALKGDSSDNIPGMAGVGEKTAVALIQGMGGIYDIKEHLEDIPKLKIRGASTFGARFLESWPTIELSYKLATINCDVPLPIKIEDLPLPRPDHDKLISLFERLEFFRFAADQRAKKANDQSLTKQAKDGSAEATATQTELLPAAEAETASATATAPAEAAAPSEKQSAASAPESAEGEAKPQVQGDVGLGLEDPNGGQRAAVLTAAPAPVAPAAPAKAKASAAGGAGGTNQKGLLKPQPKRKYEPSYAERLALYEEQQEASAESGSNVDVPKISMIFEDVFAYRDGYHLVTTEDELTHMVEALRAAGRFSLYLEESSHQIADSVLIGFACCCGEKEAYYVPLKHNYLAVPEQLSEKTVLSVVKPLLLDPEVKKIMYDLKQGRLYLHFLGVDMQGYIEDPMIMAHLLDSSRNIELSSLSKDFLGYMALDVRSLVNGKVTDPSEMDITIFKDYACERAQLAYRLYNCCHTLLQQQENGLQLLGYESQVLEVLYEMERCGALVDARKLRILTKRLKIEQFELQERIFDEAGEQFNIASTKQLAHVLFEKLKLPYPRATHKVDAKGNRVYSTADEILSEISRYMIVDLVQHYRAASKLISTYTDKLPKLITKRTGRVHTCFNLAGTVTGRLSSSEPNLQNIPARSNDGLEIRRAFVAPPGYRIVSADYSQIELRLIAHFSGDENLIRAFKNHQDIHRVTASEVLGKPLEQVTTEERNQAKATNFGLMYGMGAHGLARQTGMSYSEAKKYIECYFLKYPRIKALMDQIIADASANGYVTTLFHNRIYIKNIKSDGMSKRSAERAAVNAPMQGSAADIIKKAMVDVSAYIKTLPKNSVHMTLQVHDELVFEVRDDLVTTFAVKVKEILENVTTLKVPLEVGVGVGGSWAEAH